MVPVGTVQMNNEARVVALSRQGTLKTLLTPRDDALLARRQAAVASLTTSPRRRHPTTAAVPVQAGCPPSGCAQCRPSPLPSTSTADISTTFSVPSLYELLHTQHPIAKSGALFSSVSADQSTPTSGVAKRGEPKTKLAVLHYTLTHMLPSHRMVMFEVFLVWCFDSYIFSAFPLHPSRFTAVTWLRFKQRRDENTSCAPNSGIYLKLMYINFVHTLVFYAKQLNNYIYCVYLKQ